jgi:hypothetical protein
VYEFSPRFLNTSREVARYTHVTRLAKKLDASSAEFIHDCGWIVTLRAIVDHGDLHVLRPRVLHQHGAQRLG